MRGLAVFLWFELAASAVALLAAVLNAYAGVALLVVVVASLAAKILRLQRQQGSLQREIATLVRNEQRLKSQAYTDPLTGLANRREFDDALRREFKRAQRQQSRLALAVLDLDHLKAALAGQRDDVLACDTVEEAIGERGVD